MKIWDFYIRIITENSSLDAAVSIRWVMSVVLRCIAPACIHSEVGIKMSEQIKALADSLRDSLLLRS